MINWSDRIGARHPSVMLEKYQRKAVDIAAAFPAFWRRATAYEQAVSASAQALPVL